MSMEARGPQRGCRMTSMWPSLIREIGQMFKPLPECRGPALGDMREAFVISFNPRARSKAVFAPFGDRQIKRHAHGKIRTEGGIHRQAHCLYAYIYRGFRRDDAVPYGLAIFILANLKIGDRKSKSMKSSH